MRFAYGTGRGEVVEDVQPPLPLSTPMLLVKPPLGLATPKIFKSLDLDRRSSADPLQLLAGMTQLGKVTQVRYQQASTKYASMSALEFSVLFEV